MRVLPQVPVDEKRRARGQAVKKYRRGVSRLHRSRSATWMSGAPSAASSQAARWSSRDWGGGAACRQRLDDRGGMTGAGEAAPAPEGLVAAVARSLQPGSRHPIPTAAVTAA